MDTHTHIHFDCPPHTDNSQRFVVIRQEDPTVRIKQLLPHNHRLFYLRVLSRRFPRLLCVKSEWRWSIGYQSAVINDTVKTGMLFWAFIGSPSSFCALLDLLPNLWSPGWLTWWRRDVTTAWKGVGVLSASFLCLSWSKSLLKILLKFQFQWICLSSIGNCYWLFGALLSCSHLFTVLERLKGQQLQAAEGGLWRSFFLLLSIKINKCIYFTRLLYVIDAILCNRNCCNMSENSVRALEDGLFGVDD